MERGRATTRAIKDEMTQFLPLNKRFFRKNDYFHWLRVGYLLTMTLIEFMSEVFTIQLNMSEMYKQSKKIGFWARSAAF
jgi:hypothetical protein